MLHEGLSGVDQYTQDTRPTAIVRKHNKKIWRLIVTGVGTVNCGLKILLTALSMPPEAMLVSTRIDLAIVNDTKQEGVHSI